METKYVIYCVLIALAAFSAPASAVTIVGDANDDGRITTADSVLALQMSVGSIAPDLEMADVSGDDRVSSLDALMILTMAQKTQVYVNAPEAVSGTFDATIEACNIADLDSGQFELWFDSSVVNVTGVSSGSIDGTVVPVEDWTVVHGTDSWDCDKLVRVVFDMSGVTGVSGSGTLATIHFEVLGMPEDTSALDLVDGLLVDTGSDEISAFWFDDLITVGTPVTVSAPESVSGTFDATIDIADVTDLDSGQFDLQFDSGVVNVTGVSSGSIDGAVVPVKDWTVLHGTDSWDCDKLVRVVFDISGVTGVSGSGTLATIHFEVLGMPEDTSALDLVDGLLVDTGSDEISTRWFDDRITAVVPVTVNAPESVSGTFNATIDIADVTDLDSGQFDLSFNASVVNVMGVSAGSIDATEVGLDGWTFIDSDTVRVIFNLPGADGVSGSGTLATIHFEVLGVLGATSDLDIANELLVDTGSDEISALWFDDLVAVGIPVTVNAPESVSGTFDTTIDITDVTDLATGQFDISFNASVVNVTSVSAGSIDATEVGLDGWTFIDSDTVRVIFNLPGADGVSGSGTLATIHFKVTGTSGDTSALAISDGLLVGTDSGVIPSVWIDDEVSV